MKIIYALMLTFIIPFTLSAQTRRVIERSNPVHGSYKKGGTYVSIFGKEYPPKVKKEYDGIYYNPPPPDTTSIVTSKYRLTTKDVFKTGPITWLGVDLTHASMICFDTAIHMDELQNKYMPDWNDILIREKDKFRFNKTFHRSNVIYAQHVTAALNSRIDRDLLTDYIHLDNENLQAHIQNYNLDGLAGIGAILFIDGFDKCDQAMGYGRIVFIDMKDKILLWSAPVRGEPQGFGVRNYWANSLGHMLEYIEKNWGYWRNRILE